MLFEMLVGHPPFEGDSLAVVLRRQMLADPPALPPWVPAPVAAFVHRLLAKQPSERPATAAVAADELRRAAAAMQAPTMMGSLDALLDTEDPGPPPSMLASLRLQQRVFAAVTAAVCGVIVLVGASRLFGADAPVAPASELAQTDAAALAVETPPAAGPTVIASAQPSAPPPVAIAPDPAPVAIAPTEPAAIEPPRASAPLPEPPPVVAPAPAAREPSEPATQPSKPATQPSKPATQPSKPAARPSRPPTTEPAPRPEPVRHLRPSKPPRTESKLPPSTRTRTTERDGAGRIHLRPRA
jgi:serine/threonine-protein kinase